ncbi:MAG: hypothetical protein IKY59_05425 [Oscillospiraceae bacterium]|nr:hypothetical protein [Oscillospiraceae bacterium]
MNFLQKIKASPNYLLLKNSAQYRYEKRQFLIISACLGLALLLLLWSIGMLMQTESPSVVIMVFYALFLLGIILYFAYRWLGIFLYIDRYQFFEAKLDQPHVMGRGGVKFTVQWQDRYGNRKSKDTAPMFSSHYEPYLEEYNNQMARIGYNEKTDRLVLIGRV